MKMSEETLNATLERLTAWMQERLTAVGVHNAVVGISGGKDSSTVAALCVHAYGRDHVYGVLMPNGQQSDIDYAEDLCQSLGIRHETLNIAPMTQAFYDVLGKSAMVEEISKQTTINLPPRVRMTLLYAVAQSLDATVINTSNLSEDWVGYATVYGDATGAFSPLAMFTTDEVIQIGRALGVDEHFLVKPPTDGLSGKTDEDALGFTYETLNTYIRTGQAEPQVQAQIDALHRKSRFKFQTIPMFRSGLPIVADDIAHVYSE